MPLPIADQPTGILTLPLLAALQTPEGDDLLKEAARYTDPLLAVTLLRKRFAADLVAAAVEMLDLRRRAAAKFVNADRMFFNRESLEQASHGKVATWRAERFRGVESVADWGCGAGADSLALAKVTHVIGLDIDPIRVSLAAANARVIGRANAEFHVANYLNRPPDAPMIWADPARRQDGRRTNDPMEYVPALEQVVAHAGGRPLGVKVSPAVEADHIPPNVEAEFISVNGELKEAVFWYGDLRTCQRRATVLPEGVTLTPEGELVQTAPPADVLYDPDPAVTRAGAVKDLGRMLGAWQIDPTIAYLTGYSPIATPFAQTLIIRAWMPWNLKAVKRHLRAQNMRVEEVRKRGSAVDTEGVRKALRTDGDTPVILVLTRVEGNPAAILATRWKAEN
ncbi:MAG TPA: class I SAM-dependent methyltransferase [Armatimonadota bacterium]|jgi:SAM-dependent methyltransferase